LVCSNKNFSKDKGRGVAREEYGRPTYDGEVAGRKLNLTVQLAIRHLPQEKIKDIGVWILNKSP